MSLFCPERRKLLAGAAAMVVLCLLAQDSHGASPGPESLPAAKALSVSDATAPAEPPPPAEAAVTEDAAPVPHRPMNALKQLEQDLRRVFNVFKRESSGMPNPQMTPPVQIQRARQPQTDKDWIFKDPAETERGASRRDSASLPDSPEDLARKNMSPMERYFESYDRQRAGGMKASGPKEEDLFGMDRLNAKKRDDGDSKNQKSREEKAEESRQKEDTLRRMLGLGEDKAAQFKAPSRSSFSDALGYGRDREESLTRKTLREEYREMWGLGQVSQPGVRSDMPVSGTPSQFGLPGGLVEPEQRRSSSVSSTLGSYLPPSRPNSLDSLSGVNPVLRPDSMQEVNRRALNVWNPTASEAPTVAPAARSTRSATPVQAPQRAF